MAFVDVDYNSIRSGTTNQREDFEILLHSFLYQQINLNQQVT